MFRIRRVALPEHKKNLLTKQNYMLGPFLRGQATTILTTLRRTMLTEIEGLAPIGIYIPGVRCEYETAPGVQEDVLTILLGIKRLIFSGRIEGQNPFDIVRINVGKILREEGPILITAGDLEMPPNLKILNPEAFIATTSGSNSLKTRDYSFNQQSLEEYTWEILVGRGRGYVTCEDLVNQIPQRFIPLNNSFSPVENFGYRYESNISGTMETAFLTVQTNGSMSPEGAFSLASLYLVNSFSHLKNQIQLAHAQEELDPYNRKTQVGRKNAVERNYKSSEETQEIVNEEKWLSSQDIETEEMQKLLSGLSKRSRKIISDSGISSVKLLKTVSYEQLCKIRGCGKSSAKEILDRLAVIAEVT